MPPRARRKPPAAALPPAAASFVPDSATVHLETGHSPGYALHANLLFASDEWVTPLRADVEALLCAFAGAWERRASGERGGGGGGEMSSLKDARAAGESTGSPFEVFKGVWRELGWSNVHLLGCPEGPFRERWGEGVMRAFVERLNEGEEPLKQVAALFAVYTFWATQAAQVEKTFVKVDPVTFEHILSLPELLGPTLDASTCTSSDLTSSPPLSADLSFILHALLSSSAFLLVPSQLYNYPPLPCVSLIDVSQASHKDLSILLQSIKAESRAVREGRFSKVARAVGLSAGADEDDSDDEEDEDDDEEAAEEQDLPSWGASTLRSLAAAYSRAKTTSSSLDPPSTFSFASHSLSPAPAGVGGLLTPSSLARPRNRLQLDVLSRAEALTREAVEKLPGGGEGVLELLGGGGEGAGEGGGGRKRGMLGLVEGSRRGKKWKEENGVGELDGLRAFERAVKEKRG